MYALHHLYCYIVFLYRNGADVEPTSALSRYLHHKYHYILIEYTSALSLYSDRTLSLYSDEADVGSISDQSRYCDTLYRDGADVEHKSTLSRYSDRTLSLYRHQTTSIFCISFLFYIIF